MKNNSISATKVRLAFECPRLFYLGHHTGGKTEFHPAGRYAFPIGKEFHKLAERFQQFSRQDICIQELFRPESDDLDVEMLASQMQEAFYSSVFFSYLPKAAKAFPKAGQAFEQLWQALRELIRRWSLLLVRNRRHCPPDELFFKTFLFQEFPVEHVFSLPDGSQQLVRGVLDSLVYDFEHQRLMVAEYKTYSPGDPSAPLAQAALYGLMLHKKVGIPINSAVYWVLPEWEEQQYSWEQLQDTICKVIPYKLQQMRKWLIWKRNQAEPPPMTLQPDLCAICPQKKKCGEYFQSARKHIATASPKFQKKTTQKSASPLPNTKEQNEMAESLGQSLVKSLCSFGIKTDYQGASVAPAFIRIKIRPHAGVKVSSITKLADDLKVHMNLSHPPFIAPQSGHVSVDLPRSDRQIAYFEHYVQPQKSSPAGPLSIAIGVNLEGELTEADLSDPNTCHFLVGGTTGSGKSEFLRSILLSLLFRHPPEQLKIVLVDPKRVTFPEFEDIPWLLKPVVKETEPAIELMNGLVDEMKARYKKFESSKCPDISSYNRQNPGAIMSRIVCIFDEYADFMTEKETRKCLEQSIKQLGAMARAAGIHLIIATQRPESGVVTPLIRSNLPGRIALSTASEADSAIILGGKQKDSAYLLGKGDLLFPRGARLLRLQSLLANADIINFDQ